MNEHSKKTSDSTDAELLSAKLTHAHDKIIQLFELRLKEHGFSSLIKATPLFHTSLAQILMGQLQNQTSTYKAEDPGEYSLKEIFNLYSLLRIAVFEVLREEGPLSDKQTDLIFNMLQKMVADSADGFEQGIKNQKETQLTINETLEQMDFLFQYSGWGLIIAEPKNHTLLSVNPAFIEMHGYASADELIGKPLSMLIAPESAHEFPGHSHIAHLKDHHHYESIHVRQNGSVFPCSTDVVEVKDRNGNPLYYVANFQDITTLSQANESQSHFLTLARMDLDKLKQERQIREKFVDTLTHDLRNPLSSARAAAELLIRHKEKSDSLDRLAPMIITSIDRADKMIQDLLDANRIRAGQFLPIEIVNCDLKSVVTDALNGLNLIYEDRLVLVADKAIDGFWCCKGLRRVIENLVSNAAKYGSANTPITVSLSQHDQKVEINVHNEGKCIPQSEHARIFENFSRGKSAETGSQKGWGLGLTLVRGIAEAHGGSARVFSAVDAGTTFTIELPLDARPYQPHDESFEGHSR
ncbi:MAG: PAS domain-containing sensor histidine kinase [Bdellovibrionales bacterium]|nr:PAS domain-containing sensor histidine kinase [Bdellovibrionales bacterium]